MICSIAILGENLSNDRCRMEMRPAWLVSYAFSYTNNEFLKKMENWAKTACSRFCSNRWKFFKQTPFYSPKNSTNILFQVLLYKMIFPNVICS